MIDNYSNQSIQPNDKRNITGFSREKDAYGAAYSSQANIAFTKSGKFGPRIREKMMKKIGPFVTNVAWLLAIYIANLDDVGRSNFQPF